MPSNLFPSEPSIYPDSSRRSNPSTRSRTYPSSAAGPTTTPSTFSFRPRGSMWRVRHRRGVRARIRNGDRLARSSKCWRRWTQGNPRWPRGYGRSREFGSFWRRSGRRILLFRVRGAQGRMRGCWRCIGCWAWSMRVRREDGIGGTGGRSGGG